MTDRTSLGKPEILSIPADKPEDLFSPDLDEAKREFQRLSSRWHTDRPAGDTVVMAHVNVLYQQAYQKLTAGVWDDGKILRVVDIKGGVTELTYLKAHDFELGKFFVCQSVVGYLIRRDERELVSNGITRMGNVFYADIPTRNEFSSFMPEFKHMATTADHFLVIIKKSPTQILLKDVIDHYGGKLDPRHVAWITSRLYNLICYLRSVKLCHNAISPGSIFIDPTDHRVSLLGGWWYMIRRDEKLRALPTTTVMQVPSNLIDLKVGDHLVDAELVKYVARASLGDANGARLKADKNIPNPLRSWLQTPASGKVYTQFKIWKKEVLVQSFGPPKFIEMKLTLDEVYKP